VPVTRPESFLMFDISWTEFLLIGVVALVVIGPKELPAVMRTMGQWTRKIRGMANDFQNQFQEAMREAEMADLKKSVDDLAQGVAKDFTNIDPLKSVRDDVENVGKDIEKSFAAPPAQKAAEPSPEATADTAPAAAEAAALPAPGEPLPIAPDAYREKEEAVGSVTPAPGNTERTG
jgi:sec-independent protein translocase protein TatB